MKKTGALIIYAMLVITILGGAVSGVMYLTNGGTTGARLFDVQFDGKNIDGLVVPLPTDGTPIEFVLAPKLGQKLPNNLQVRALPGADAQNVRYIVDNKSYTFSAINDLSALFDITSAENVVTVSSTWDLVGFLADYYDAPRDAVALEEYKKGAFAFVDLCFISGDLTIKCALIEYIGVTGVELEPGTLVIGG